MFEASLKLQDSTNSRWIHSSSFVIIYCNTWGFCEFTRFDETTLNTIEHFLRFIEKAWGFFENTRTDKINLDSFGNFKVHWKCVKLLRNQKSRQHHFEYIVVFSKNIVRAGGFFVITGAVKIILNAFEHFVNYSNVWSFFEITRLNKLTLNTFKLFCYNLL